MKRNLAGVIAVSIAALLFAGCGGSSLSAEQTEKCERVQRSINLVQRIALEQGGDGELSREIEISKKWLADNGCKALSPEEAASLGETNLPPAADTSSGVDTTEETAGKDISSTTVSGGIPSASSLEWGSCADYPIGRALYETWGSDYVDLQCSMGGTYAKWSGSTMVCDWNVGKCRDASPGEGPKVPVSREATQYVNTYGDLEWLCMEQLRDGSREKVPLDGGLADCLW
jgi:hypothetical protein